MVKSPPTNSWLPSVAIACGPRLPTPDWAVPTLVAGVQCPSVPSVRDWSSRCQVTQPPPWETCGKPPGAYAQSCACEPLNKKPFMTSTACVAPRQSFCHTSESVDPRLTAKSPSKQPPPLPSAARYAVLPLITTFLTVEVQVPGCHGTIFAVHGTLAVPVAASTAPAAFCDTPLIVWKYPPSTTCESSGATARLYTVLFSDRSPRQQVPRRIHRAGVRAGRPVHLREVTAEVDLRPARRRPRSYPPCRRRRHPAGRQARRGTERGQVVMVGAIDMIEVPPAYSVLPSGDTASPYTPGSTAPTRS